MKKSDFIIYSFLLIPLTLLNDKFNIINRDFFIVSLLISLNILVHLRCKNLEKDINVIVSKAFSISSFLIIFLSFVGISLNKPTNAFYVISLILVLANLVFISFVYIYFLFFAKDQISIEKKNKAIYNLKLGNTAFKKKQFQEAINYYSESIKINNNLKEAFNNRALAKKALGDYSGFSKDNKKSKSSFGFLSNYLSDENLIYKLSGFSILIIAAIGTLKYGFDLGFYEHIFWVFLGGSSVVLLIVPVYIISLLSSTDKYSMTFMSIVYGGLIFGTLTLWGVVALSILSGEDLYTPTSSIKIDPSRI